MFKAQCTKENLTECLDQLNQLAGKNPSLPILSHIYIKAENGIITAQATNLEIGMECQVRGKVISDGVVAIPGKILSDLVRNSKGIIHFEAKEGIVEVITENSTTDIHCSPADDFPAVPWFENGQRVEMSAQSFGKALNSVSFAASADQHRPELQSVCLKLSNGEGAVVATDGFRLAETIMQLPDFQLAEDNSTVLIPLRTAALVSRALESAESDLISCSYNENEIIFNFGSTKVLSRLLHGRYPDYRQIIPTVATSLFVASAREFLSAVKNAGLFCRPGIQDIRVAFSSGTAEVSGSSDLAGKNSTVVQGIGEGEQLSVTFNFRYLSDALQHVTTEYVGFFMQHPHQPVVLLPYQEKPEAASLAIDREKAVSSAPQRFLIMPIKQ